MKPPIKVLMLGEHWNRFDQPFASLSDRGIVDFVGPVIDEIQEAVSLTGPSALIISPGSSQFVRTSSSTPRGGQRSLPPILVCVDYDSLETDELYEYGDDFVLLPCSAAELEKRLSRLVRGRQPEFPLHLLRLGEITLNTLIYEVRIGGRRVDLAWMEFQLLRYLMENTGRVFTRDELLASVWGVDSFGGTRTVDVHIRRLRQKLGLYGNAYIRTVPNVGYGLVEP